MSITKDHPLRTSAVRIQKGHTPRLASTFATAAAAALISLWSSAAFAEQFVVLDSTWEHTPDLPDSHYRVAPLPGTPSDWKSPIDYASGTAYVHLEVYTKPTDTPTKFQVCFEAQPTYACTDQSPTYTAAGVIDWSTPFQNFYVPPGKMVDWSKGTVKIAVILKDTKNGKPSADNVGAETAALYTPTKVRMVVTIVAPGSEYIPPDKADAGAPDDAGTGEPDSGAGTGGSGGAGAGAGTGGSDAGSGGSPGAPQPGPTADSGCSVAPVAGGDLERTGAGPFLLLAAAALARRGRARSANSIR